MRLMTETLSHNDSGQNTTFILLSTPYCLLSHLWVLHDIGSPEPVVCVSSPKWTQQRGYVDYRGSAKIEKGNIKSNGESSYSKFDRLQSPRLESLRSSGTQQPHNTLQQSEQQVSHIPIHPDEKKEKLTRSCIRTCQCGHTGEAMSLHLDRYQCFNPNLFLMHECMQLRADIVRGAAHRLSPCSPFSARPTTRLGLLLFDPR